MYFNSFNFLFFIFILFIIYWRVDEKYRWILLLASSYFFYLGWGIIYLLILIFLTLLSYIAGIIIHKNREKKLGKVFVIIIVTSMVLLLCGFKYSIFSTQPFLLKLVMPIGMSFYTFKIISYLVDIYRGEGMEYHLGRYALFVAFFPEISSGPIDRGNQLLAQLSKRHVFDYDKATYGLKLICWGFLKKVIIADALADYVDRVWASMYSHQGFSLVLISLFFTIQIYCDFSGYSDMAIGIAKLLDIDIMINFCSPYFSASVKEFWQRWHCSLSTWLRDYIYIPLGGSRCNKKRWIINVMVTFLVSGIWHGAGLTYIIWGALHGLAQITEFFLFKKSTNGWRKVIRIGGTFLFCNFAWIFFRAESLKQIEYVLCHFFSGIKDPLLYIQQGWIDLRLDSFMFARTVLLLMILFVFDYINMSKDVIEMISQQKKLIRWIIYISLVLLIIIFLPVKQAQEFIYFQF